MSYVLFTLSEQHIVHRRKRSSLESIFGRPVTPCVFGRVDPDVHDDDVHTDFLRAASNLFANHP